MGTGVMVKEEGICKGVKLRLQNVTIEDDFLPLKLGSSDVILRMQWLRELGEMQVNWQTLTMTFTVAGVTVTLKGDPNLSGTSVSMKSM